MKKTLFFLILLIAAGSVQAGDLITLTNGMQFEGKVKRVEKCSVAFKARGRMYEIPATDILTVVFENPSDRVYLDYLTTMAGDPDACLKGKQDAENYHGKAGLHMVLGVLFGPFAVIGAAVSSPTPATGSQTMLMSKNKELFGDPEYLSCYQKKARGINVGNAAIGWAAWVALVILSSL